MRRHTLILWILCILPTLAFGMPIAEPLPSTTKWEVSPSVRR